MVVVDGGVIDPLGMTILLVRLALYCMDAVGVVWLLTAIWFAATRKGTLRGKVWHFLRTLLPEPWMLVGIVIIIVALHFIPLRAWRPVTLHRRALIDLGSVLIVASSLLMVWARLVLGNMWAGRPMVQEGHELRTGGPYGLVRHPIYTGIIGLVLGLTLLAGFGGVIVVLVFVLAWLLWRVRVEDAMMLATFGDQYRAYQRRVRALIPFPRLGAART
jgi:protein-S-isoprenylcysteine O-methyltransferase Ste14